RAAGSPAALHARLDDGGLFGANVALPARFAAYLSGLRTTHRSALGRYPGLDSRPWHDPARFAIVADLERHAEAIAAECRALGDAFHGEQEPIERKGAWDVAFLWERGRRHADFAQRCPVTTAVVERHRIVRGPAGLVYFSRLTPGTRISLHAGPTNLRLRCHLGIDVPENCAISVGGETRMWTAGRCFVFDDSFPHEAWNDGDRDRLVLIVDLWHPDLTDDEIAMLEGLHRHVEGHAQNLRTYWERNDAAREGATTAG
ncbi:MAG TPA: aspartyl/asparaginyl beta-hydroxylase domain-containing protein, partial [Candidatus Elarobacter sp.]